MRILIFLTSIFISISSFEKNNEKLVGKIKNERGEPISYASIFFKQNPEIGTVSDLHGVFKIQKPENSATLIVSFIGHETQEIPLTKKILNADTLRLTLKEEPIMIEETVVSAKLSKTKKKRAMKEFLQAVRNKMSVDLPDFTHKYKIVSDVSVLAENGEIIGFDEMIGDLVVIPEKGKKEYDSLQFRPTTWKRYTPEEVDKRLQNLQNLKLNKNERKFINSINQTSEMHRFLWGSNTLKDFEKKQKEVKKWTLSRENDKLSVLTYQDETNILGIVKISFSANYIIDTYTLGLKKISKSAKAFVNIPFGYKFSKEQLAMLNVLNFQGENIEKFRAKKIYGEVKRNIFFEEFGGKVLVKEKSNVSDLKLETRKGDSVVIKNATKLRTLSAETKNVQPFSHADLSRKIEKTLVPVPKN